MFLILTEASPLWLFKTPKVSSSAVRGGGVIQGDPLSMFMYAIGTVPLVQKLESPSLWRQLWYADDASVLGDTHSLKVWLDKLKEVGPLFGYIPEPTKSTLIVKESSPGCPPNSPFRAQVWWLLQIGLSRWRYWRCLRHELLCLLQSRPLVSLCGVAVQHCCWSTPTCIHFLDKITTTGMALPLASHSQLQWTVCRHWTPTDEQISTFPFCSWLHPTRACSVLSPNSHGWPQC